MRLHADERSGWHRSRKKLRHDGGEKLGIVGRTDAGCAAAARREREKLLRIPELRFNNLPKIHGRTDEENRIVSFHEIPNSRYYSAEEHDFWQVIVGLIMAGYRVQ